MEFNVVSLASLIGGLVLGAIIFYVYLQIIGNKKKNSAQKEAELSIWR